MALQPIDLQTLFVRLGQIGKEQAALKESSVLEQEARGNEMAKRARLRDESVNQTNELEDESGKIREKEEGSTTGSHTGEGGGGGEKSEEEREKRAKNIFEDPALGKNIDISG